MISNLSEYLELLRKEKELIEIKVPVSPYLEVAEIHRRIVAEEGPALLFKNIEGSTYSLATNLFGSKKRIELAFGPRPAKFISELANIPKELIQPSLGKLWEHRHTLSPLLKLGLSNTSKAPVMEVVERPAKLKDLPLLTTWAEDGGPFITLPLVYTEHPQTKIHNLGIYRLQRYDENSTGFHCQIGKGGGFHLAEAKERGAVLPVNVFIGGPPALILAAIAPLPENAPELLLASLVLGSRLKTCRSPFSLLPILAESEFALLGEVNPNEMCPEGPFGDHYGYLSLKHDYPVFRCHTVFRRKNPICTATVVGKPKQEDFYLGDYLQELLSPLFPLVMPAVEDLWSFGETGFHSLAAAVVKQRYKREAMSSAFRILGEGQLSLTKFLMVVDKKINIRDFRLLLEHILERADFRTDFYIFSNLSMDTLDYTGPKVNEGSKGVLLGVGDPIRKLLREFNSSLPSIINKAKVFCRGCLVIEGKTYLEEPKLAEKVATHPSFEAWPLIVLVDNASEAVKSQLSFLWTTFTRFEPGSDVYAKEKNIERNHISYFVPIVIDARKKPSYPPELECDTDTMRLVDRRWREYFNVT